MTNVIHVNFAKHRKPVCPVSESLAAFRLAVIRSEKLMEELEAVERDLDAMLKQNPNGGVR